ncbi:hypothetical protein FFX45_10720 [Thermosynechococcus sp. CL-1]|uniref:hypothetical protein n=1 Tax=unclassified Thermosynechococcus TaxID=2622553 RepID=UPI00122E4AC9|nr:MULTISPECIES: hypothetical protein [unclassified Thermosynechococcus]QEQ01805.1 hypothetical protein FFX45_10720 [Thermosynechococcus sp. CL-1]WJI26191.1 hypothetical protein M0644_10810 [Thermosynechococcus sp. B1]WJI28716.1 hypothetical protein M0646_10795 [Thermosynechococcus sp. B3]WNC64995.1 hypothetical protein RHK28_10910 [Thermosynechococcus sp. HY593]
MYSVITRTQKQFDNHHSLSLSLIHAIQTTDPNTLQRKLTFSISPKYTKVKKKLIPPLMSPTALCTGFEPRPTDSANCRQAHSLVESTGVSLGEDLSIFSGLVENNFTPLARDPSEQGVAIRSGRGYVEGALASLRGSGLNENSDSLSIKNSSCSFVL